MHRMRLLLCSRGPMVGRFAPVPALSIVSEGFGMIGWILCKFGFHDFPVVYGLLIKCKRKKCRCLMFRIKDGVS